MTIQEAIAKLLESEDLSRDEMVSVVDQIMSGPCSCAVMSVVCHWCFVMCLVLCFILCYCL